MSLYVNINHAFGAFNLNVEFTAPNGITAIFGRSGSGKTSIANAIAGLIKLDSGEIKINEDVLYSSDKNIDCPAHNRQIGYVFQEGRLFPHLSVEKNLKFSERFSDHKISDAQLMEIAKLLDIEPILKRMPINLSGGEKQRVAIGRALLSNPALLIMDEPLASLDEYRKAEIIPYLERLRDEVKIPILYVSHSLSEIARLATTLIAIHNGKIIKSGDAAKLLSDPDAVPVFGVRDAGAILPARILSHDDQDAITELTTNGGTLQLPRIDAPVGSFIRIRIEAHDIIIAKEAPKEISTLNILPAIITNIREGDGPGAAVGLTIGDDPLLARITRRSVRRLNLKQGDECFIILKSTSVAPVDIGLPDQSN